MLQHLIPKMGIFPKMGKSRGRVAPVCPFPFVPLPLPLPSPFSRHGQPNNVIFQPDFQPLTPLAQLFSCFCVFVAILLPLSFRENEAPHL